MGFAAPEESAFASSISAQPGKGLDAQFFLDRAENGA
jgi:hypothetical protein